MVFSRHWVEVIFRARLFRVGFLNAKGLRSRKVVEVWLAGRRVVERVERCDMR